MAFPRPPAAPVIRMRSIERDMRGSFWVSRFRTGAGRPAAANGHHPFERFARGKERRSRVRDSGGMKIESVGDMGHGLKAQE